MLLKKIFSLIFTFLLFSHFLYADDYNGTVLSYEEEYQTHKEALKELFKMIKDHSLGNLEDDVYFHGLKVFGNELAYSAYGLESLTDQEFNAMSDANKWTIANKLLAAFFYGIPKVELETLINSSEFITSIKAMFDQSNSDLPSVEEQISSKYLDYNSNRMYAEQILARLFFLSKGKEYINRWSAYVLTQTILFSPAYELYSVNYADVARVYNRMVRDMDEGYTMQFSTFMHMIGDENWRRFRSPEDNGREMLEIYLLDFDDSHVPISGQALKNWKLDRDRGNVLVIGLDPNTEALNLFGTTIYDGYDFYRELVKYTGFLPGITKRLVSIYFSDFNVPKQQEIISKIVSSNPERFQDILKQIVLSKEFLLNSNRVKSFEETFYGLSKSTFFEHRKDQFRIMRDYMDDMHQSTMRYKLGRSTKVPDDTLSFATYHKYIREQLMINPKNDEFNEYDSGWSANYINNNEMGENIDKLLKHIFLSTILRIPTDDEKNVLKSYIVDEKSYDLTRISHRMKATKLTMDYISRLSQLYQFEKYISETPLSPGSLQFTDVNDSAVSMQWSDNSEDETMFNIYKNGSLIYIANPNKTGFIDTEVSSSTTYTYEIEAVNNAGNSISTDLTLTTTGEAPAAPITLTFINITANSVTLNWTDNSFNPNNETGFKIFRRIQGENWSDIPVITVGQNIITYIDNGLTANTTYEYMVKATSN